MTRRRRIMKSVVALLLVGLAVAGGGCGEERAAVVNGDAITVAELEKRVDYLILASGHGMTRSLLRGQVLNDLIQERVLVAEAHRQGLAPKPGEVKDRVDLLLKTLKENNFGGDEKALATALGRAGLSRGDLAGIVSAELSFEKVREKVEAGTVVAEEEIRAYYDENRKDMWRPATVSLQELVLPDRDTAVAAVRALRKNPDLDVAAASLGEKAGGVKPVRHGVAQGTLPASLDKVIFNLPPGTILGLVQDQDAIRVFDLEEDIPQVENGKEIYIIWKKEGVSPASEIPLEEVRDRIEASLLAQKRPAAFEQFAAELERRSTIRRYQ